MDCFVKHYKRLPFSKDSSHLEGKYHPLEFRCFFVNVWYMWAQLCKKEAKKNKNVSINIKIIFAMTKNILRDSKT